MSDETTKEVEGEVIEEGTETQEETQVKQKLSAPRVKDKSSTKGKGMNKGQ